MFPQRDIGYAGLKDAEPSRGRLFRFVGQQSKRSSTCKSRTLPFILPSARQQAAARTPRRQSFRGEDSRRDPDGCRQTPAGTRPDPEARHAQLFRRAAFGRRGNNDRLGAALVRGDNIAVLKLLLGGPDPDLDDAATLRTREAFDRNDNDAAMKAWPRRSARNAASPTG